MEAEQVPVVPVASENVETTVNIHTEEEESGMPLAKRRKLEESATNGTHAVQDSTVPSSTTAAPAEGDKLVGQTETDEVSMDCDSDDDSFEEMLAINEIPAEHRGEFFESFVQREKESGKSEFEILAQLGFKYLVAHLDTNEDAAKMISRAILASKDNKATLERQASQKELQPAKEGDGDKETNGEKVASSDKENNGDKEVNGEHEEQEKIAEEKKEIENQNGEKDSKSDLLSSYLGGDLDDDYDDDDDNDGSYNPADDILNDEGSMDSEEGILITDPVEILALFTSHIRHSEDHTEPRRKLPEINGENDAIKLIENAQKVVVLSGAGISVACGVPDFRSPGGLYDQIKEKYQLTDPQLLFDITYMRQNQVPFYDFAAQLFPSTELVPSKAHKFIKLLQDKGKLLRNYSQNIDTLEQQVGIASEKLILCHGSFATFSCPKGHQVDGSVIKPHLDTKKIPQCETCNNPTGAMFMKPDIVFFGEALPDAFRQHVKEDVKEADLLIVMGSSLRVQPVALVPPLFGETAPKTPQLLFNRELVAQPHEFDHAFLSDCDSAVERVCEALGWAL